MIGYQIGHLFGTLMGVFFYMLIIGSIYYWLQGRRVPFRQAILNRWNMAVSVILFLLVLVSRGASYVHEESSHVYPEPEVSSFITSCSQSAKAIRDETVIRATCVCTINEIQKRYTYGEFKQLAVAMTEDPVLPTNLSDILVACIQKQAHS